MSIADGAEGWMAEFGKSALTGAGAGSLAGVLGAGLYAWNAGSARTATCPSWTRTPGTIALAPGQSPPPLCSAVVDLPVLGTTTSLAQAAVGYGMAVAVLGFIAALAVFLVARHRNL